MDDLLVIVLGICHLSLTFDTTGKIAFDTWYIYCRPDVLLPYSLLTTVVTWYIYCRPDVVFPYSLLTTVDTWYIYCRPDVLFPYSLLTTVTVTVLISICYSFCLNWVRAVY